ncbi:hypothetical protein phiGT1_20 [Sulfitobacter phage phiGT1]|nr:hypothetical protein phiGT1_20 [Sulfitobacter phage phiGT1]
MDILDFAIAVFIGNGLTASMFWGFQRMSGYKQEKDAPWLVYAAIGVPIMFLVLTLISSFGLPQTLDALASR